MPLLAAVGSEQNKLTELLLRHGADPRTPDSDSDTLSRAIEKNFNILVELMNESSSGS